MLFNNGLGRSAREPARTIGLILGIGYLTTVFLTDNVAPTLELVSAFVKSPYFFGILVCLLSFGFLSSKYSLAELVKAVGFTILLAFYVGRPEVGDIWEMKTLRTVPSAIQIIIGALFYVGCLELKRNRIAQVAFIFAALIFVMRDQGQVILAYLAGLVWMPTRDNFLIDFAIILVCITGLQRVKHANLLGCGLIILMIGCTYPNMYFSNPDGLPLPEINPYRLTVPAYRGSPETVEALEVVKNLSGEPWRVVFDPEGGFQNYSHGLPFYHFSAARSAEVGQITQYSNLNTGRFVKWLVWHQHGVNLGDKAGAYPGLYSDRTRSKLPSVDESIPLPSVIGIPPVHEQFYRLLGVKFVLQRWQEISDETIRKLKLVNQHRVTDEFYLAEISDPLPRAFAILGVDEAGIDLIKKSKSPQFSTDHFLIGDQENRYNTKPIDEYSDNYVRIKLNVPEKSMLVLTDLWHPFWKVTVDNQEQAIVPAFVAFRGVQLEPGEHVVEFFVEVPWWSQSLWISGVAFLIFICVSMVLLKGSAAMLFREVQKDEIVDKQQ